MASILLAALMALASAAGGCRVHEGGDDDTPDPPEARRSVGDDDSYRARGYMDAMREAPAGDDTGASDGD
jgi:hypothetical protein